MRAVERKRVSGTPVNLLPYLTSLSPSIYDDPPLDRVDSPPSPKNASEEAAHARVAGTKAPYVYHILTTAGHTGAVGVLRILYREPTQRAHNTYTHTRVFPRCRLKSFHWSVG